MALANFFDKGALAAHQVLGGIDSEALPRLLEDEVVGVAVDAAAAGSMEGRHTALLAVDLLARFYPRLSIRTLGAEGPDVGRLVESLEQRARAINDVIELVDCDPTRQLVVGETAVKAEGSVAYVGSDGWTFRISPSRPMGCGDSGNPFGAAVAACIGVANVFRAVMKPYLRRALPDAEFSGSLIDWSPTTESSTGPSLDDVVVEIDETLLGGVGAIGNAAVWALARVPDLKGELVLIDHQDVDLTNLQRYLLTDQSSVEALKVDLAARQLRQWHGNLVVRAEPKRWGEYLRERNDWLIERVLTAFDTPAARISAQAALPRRLLNAWTQLGDLGVSRHLAFGRSPCVACLYPQRQEGLSYAERIGIDLGFAGATKEIKELLYRGTPISEDFVRRVANNLRLKDQDKLEVLLGGVGRPLRDFHTDAACGMILLSLGVKPDQGVVEAPMAFQSALAGVMLAAELVLDALREQGVVRFQPSPRTVINLLRPIPAYPHPGIGRAERCVCRDRDYLRVYQSKWGSGGPERSAGKAGASEGLRA